MASRHQLRGALLEEVILVLLCSSGYVPVAEVGQDPTLSRSGASLQVKGRGANHQIDAIADFTIPQPFTNPQRLLVEAKAYDANKVDLGVVRNVVGVLKDVNEYWRAEGRSACRRLRYHYQSAIFSATGFTSHAQTYAYAQDIYLLPLRRSAHFTPILDALNQVSDALAEEPNSARIGELRRQFRAWLDGIQPHPDPLLIPLLDACEDIRSALLGMIADRFPIFLVPDRPEALEKLESRMQMQIHFGERGWFLGPLDDEYMFSFDLPDELFERYAENGQLSRTAAADMKEEMFQAIKALYIRKGQLRVITFELDRTWLERIREQTRGNREVATNND